TFAAVQGGSCAPRRRMNGDENEAATQARAERPAWDENPAARGEQGLIAPRHGSFRDAAVGAARLSTAAPAPNPLRAVLRGMRGIRHHTGSIRIVDDAFTQSQSRPKFIGPRIGNRPYQCCRRPQSTRETRSRRALPQPERRAYGACAVDPRRRSTDAENVPPDAARAETSAQPASPAGARRPDDNADPAHQWKQSPRPGDLPAQLKSDRAGRMPAAPARLPFRMRRLEYWAASHKRPRAPCIARRSQQGCGNRRWGNRSAAH